MTAIFTNSFRAALAADVTLMDGPGLQVEMVMFPTAAALRPDQEVDALAPVVGSPYAAIDTIAGLEAALGWGPSVPQRATTTIGTVHTTVGTTYYSLTDSIGYVLPAGFPKSMVKAIAFVYKGTKQGMQNKVMFVTDTPVSTGTVMYPGDGVIPQVDPTKGRVLLSWASDGVLEGPLVRTVGARPFEPARTQHLWIYPQRMNMVANPSFEEATDFWRSDGTVTQLTTDIANTVRAATTENLTALSGLLTIDTVTLVANDRVLVKDQTLAQNNGVYIASASTWTRATDSDSAAELTNLQVYVKFGSQRGEVWTCTPTVTPVVMGTTPLPWTKTPSTGGGNFYGHFAAKVVESNTFPMVSRLNERGWTVQLRVRSDGEIKVGFLAWGPDFVATAADWGHPEERWLSNGAWLNVRTLRDIGEATTAMLRVETQGSYLDLDTVCVEFGTLPSNYDDWGYFDGASLYGVDGDFTWYERPNKSYSCWYNDRTAVMGRLFSWNMSTADAQEGGVFTDEEAAKQGLAHQWVPAGTPLMSHTDVLFPDDPKAALPPVTGSVLVRQNALGVPGTGAPNPWKARTAYAGKPGAWGPTAWTSPAPLPPLNYSVLHNSGIQAYPITPWATGEWIQTQTAGTDGCAYWDGNEWQQGIAPAVIDLFPDPT